MTGFFTGTGTAMITPFAADGSVNFEAFGRMIEYQIANGTDMLLVLGTTGEPPTMTEEEKRALMRYTVEKVRGRAKIVFGCGSNSTAHAVEGARIAEELGADGLLAVTPYYNKCTQRGIVEYYKAICAATRLPVIAYNVPPRTGVNILPPAAEELSSIPNMAGIKEACGNMEQICETMRRVRGKMDVYSGDDNLNLPILAIGGAGLISVVSNIVPRECRKVYEYVQAGDLKKANELEDKLLPLIDACFTEVNPIPVKYGCNLIGLDAGLPRPPLTELEDAHKKIMEECIARLGVKRV
ncbi:MAG TPA: 4-hydroxy-tetrahydrodipicolinate synthase [Candidatus Coproplasma excrementavium]|nr:4-hydroxy-tetrahydrodipicolinate synthase [Candidatus Coproplasma excrementavium]